jgi:hypothetical protein
LRKDIAQSDALEIADRLEWTWVEDATSLDGASTSTLRQRFRVWVADEVARQPGACQPAVIPRFRYFIKVDQEVLHSLTEPIFQGKRWLRVRNVAFVKFVDSNWELSSESEKQEDEDFWGQEILEPIEGCTEEDVGWMRIAPLLISFDFYDMLAGDENRWFVFYERPPRIIWH